MITRSHASPNTPLPKLLPSLFLHIPKHLSEMLSLVLHRCIHLHMPCGKHGALPYLFLMIVKRGEGAARRLLVDLKIDGLYAIVDFPGRDTQAESAIVAVRTRREQARSWGLVLVEEFGDELGARLEDFVFQLFEFLHFGCRFSWLLRIWRLRREDSSLLRARVRLRWL